MRYKVFKNGEFDNLIECEESHIEEFAKAMGYSSYEAEPYPEEEAAPAPRKMTIADIWMATNPEVQKQIRELIAAAEAEQAAMEQS